MENANVLNELNDYNLMINQALVAHVAVLEVKNERIASLLSHIINAHQIWNERIMNQPNRIGVFEVRPAETLIAQSRINHSVTKEILANDDLMRELHYKSSQGKSYRNTVAEILLHLFNHHSYHRGQVNQLLVAEGLKPLVTDYIFYNRTEL